MFIGPCAAKKLEASRTSVRSDVDFVITFEELLGMFDARDICPSGLEEDSSFQDVYKRQSQHRDRGKNL